MILLSLTMMATMRVILNGHHESDPSIPYHDGHHESDPHVPHHYDNYRVILLSLTMMTIMRMILMSLTIMITIQ